MRRCSETGNSLEIMGQDYMVKICQMGQNEENGIKWNELDKVGLYGQMGQSEQKWDKRSKKANIP